MNEFGTINPDFDTPYYDSNIERMKKYREQKCEREKIYKRNEEYYKKHISRNQNLSTPVHLSGKPIKVLGGYDEMRELVEKGKFI